VGIPTGYNHPVYAGPLGLSTLRLVPLGFRRSPQFDYVAAGATCLALLYSRGAPLGGVQRLPRFAGKDTLLRLLLPLNDQVWTTFRPWIGVATLPRPVRKPHLAIQSVVATGGVYKRQGRNQRKLMTCAY
jgi:hypothetical protein